MYAISIVYAMFAHVCLSWGQPNYICIQRRQLLLNALAPPVGTAHALYFKFCIPGILYSCLIFLVL